jgi:hypothetical protein
MRQFLGVFVVVLALVVPVTARAEQHVDWSQYIDTSAPAKAPTTQQQQPRPARATKATRPSKKIAKARGKARPKKARAARQRK